MVPMSSYSCPDPSPPPPPTLCKQTLNHLHSNVPDVQNISIFHTSPHRQHNQYQEGCINPHCAFCPSRTPHTSLSPSYFLSFPNFSDHLPSLPRFQFHYQNTQDTSTIDPSFDTIRCTTPSQNRR